MTRRAVQKALNDAGIPPWQAEDIKVPAGWNSTGCIAWRSKYPSRGTLDHDNPKTLEIFEAESEKVIPTGEFDCEFGDPTTLFQFRDGTMFGVNTRFVELLDGMEVRAIREFKTIMLVGVKNGRNEIVIAERRVQ